MFQCELHASATQEKSWMKLPLPDGCNRATTSISSADPWPRTKGLEPWAYWAYCGGSLTPANLYKSCAEIIFHVSPRSGVMSSIRPARARFSDRRKVSSQYFVASIQIDCVLYLKSFFARLFLNWHAGFFFLRLVGLVSTTNDFP